MSWSHDTSHPLLNGLEISTMTRTSTKFPLCISELSTCLITVPNVALKLKATFLVSKEKGRSWTCTQNVVLQKLISFTSFWSLYCSNATRCLSYVHDSPCKTFSTFTSNSKVKRAILSSATLISKFRRFLYKGRNVFARASMFIALRVKNLPVRANSGKCFSLDKSNFDPSVFVRESFFHF